MSGTGPHPSARSVGHLLTGLGVAPERLGQRLALITGGPPAEAVVAAEALLADVVTLTNTHTDADIAAFRTALAERRRAIDPPERDY